MTPAGKKYNPNPLDRNRKVDHRHFLYFVMSARGSGIFGIFYVCKSLYPFLARAWGIALSYRHAELPPS